MRLLTKRPLVWAAGVLFAGSTALAATALDGGALGWTPLVSLWGRGDAGTAVKALRSVTEAYDTVLHRTEIDEPTQKFIDKAFDELEDFDLDGFYELLPEERQGARELLVRGDLSGKKYLVRRASAGSEVGLKGPRRGLADMSGSLRAQPNENHGEHKSYLIGGRLGLGIGPLSWRALMDAATDLMRLSSTGDPRPGASGSSAPGSLAAPAPSAEAKTRVKALNPGLGDEDVEVLALLFEGFPALGNALGAFGRVEDVRAVPVAGASFQHLTVRMRVEPERLKKKYPDMAKHLGKLKDLARLDARWVDGQGRSIMNIKAGTARLSIAIDCYVKEGHLLPFKGSEVFESEPIDLMGASLARSRLHASARVEMLGVIVHLGKLRLDLSYEPRETYGSVEARLTTVPDIRVEGRALGFLPTGLVDAFIPGNMESLTRDFFEVAVKGNGGKGVVLHMDVGSEGTSGQGVFAGSLAVEALDNFLVKTGVGIVNDRVLPSDDASDDNERFAAELHDAFVKDLYKFQSKVGG
jgi:hypothetical protein